MPADRAYHTVPNMTVRTRPMVEVWALVAGVVLAACGGGASPSAGAGASEAATAASATTLFARKLGGAGFERAAGLATCPDGSIVAASHIGDAMATRTFGVTRISPAGATLWARTFDLAGEGGVVGVACSPLRNVFVGIQVVSGSVDLGGGPVSAAAAVVKLSPSGVFTWQHVFDGTLLLDSIAVDGHGSVLAGLSDRSSAAAPRAVKLTWDDRVAWSVTWTSAGTAGGRVAVAWDPAENAIVAQGGTIRKLSPDGARIWERSLVGEDVFVSGVGTTAIGTVVATGRFSGTTLSAGGQTMTWELVSSTQPSFAAALEANGDVRWLRPRASDGPIAVDPIGRIAFIDLDGPMLTGADCRSDLVRWDLTGKELWRRPLVRCDPFAAPGWGAFGRAVAIGLGSQIWAQGDAMAAFDPGTGTMLTPRASDWFLLRVAP
jgi:hypothetical protein